MVVVVTVTGQQEQNGTSEEEQVTGPSLTGNPQIDYVWDPNLPRELNGYNLSAYPFYSTVPAKMEFDCDQLHDGFYADVAHECQVSEKKKKSINLKLSLISIQYSILNIFNEKKYVA